MSQPILSRVPLHMRYSREYLFEPKFVSVGPLYYEKLKEQKAIEKAKYDCILYFVSKLPTSTSNPDINDLIEKWFNDHVPPIDVAEMKVKIKKWYGKNFGLNEDNLFKMLVRDSCFIIRIILAFSREGEDNMFYPGVDIKMVRFDLLLMENQIPFFFLKKVYEFLRDKNILSPLPASDNSTSNSNSQNDKATNCVCCLVDNTCMCCCLPFSIKNQFTLSLEQSQNQSQSHSQPSCPQQTTNLDEFLKELKPFIWLDMPWQFNEHPQFTDDEPTHLLDLYWKWCIPPPSDDQATTAPTQSRDVVVHETWVKIHQRSNAPKRIKNAYELYQRAGVTFQKREHEHGFGVTFRRGILQMPHLQLDPNQTTLLANLVAFEEFKPSNEQLITSYVLLLDGLISTEKDVEILQRHGVITNKLSSTQMASTYFNDIGNVCSVNYSDHYCKNQFNDLNIYYKSKWHCHCAKLRRKNFNSPWAIISLLAGAFLLSLSAIQTGYSIARFYQHR